MTPRLTALNHLRLEETDDRVGEGVAACVPPAGHGRGDAILRQTLRGPYRDASGLASRSDATPPARWPGSDAMRTFDRYTPSSALRTDLVLDAPEEVLHDRGGVALLDCRRDRPHPPARLALIRGVVFVDEGGHHFARRESSAWARHGAAFRWITLVRRSSRFSRSSSFSRSRSGFVQGRFPSPHDPTGLRSALAQPHLRNDAMG
jgi:hypothetical protein